MFAVDLLALFADEMLQERMFFDRLATRRHGRFIMNLETKDR